MKNVQMTLVEDDTLVIRIDLKEEHGVSKSGKSVTIASTGGNISIPIPGHEDIKVGLNVYREKK